MKILMTADTVGGVWTYAIELARALGNHSVEVALATMGAPLSDEQREEAGSIANLRVHESAYRLEWMDDPWKDVQAAGQWLMHLQEMVRPDVVHLNGYVHGSLSWEAPVLVVGHSCVLSWWEAVKGEAAPGHWDRYRQEVSLGLRAADMVLAPSRAMLDCLHVHYGPFTASGVTPNGRTASLFPPGRKESCVFVAGRVWDEAKNIEALANAAHKTRWPVYVAGDPEHPSGTERRLSGIHLIGKLPPQAVSRWLAGASIYALPAKYEPFGFSALEAALAGCALVLGDIPSLREVWGEAALFVHPDDADALADTINLLIEDDELRAKMAARSRDRAAEYTPERMAAGYLRVYEDMLHERGIDTGGFDEDSYVPRYASHQEETDCVS